MKFHYYAKTNSLYLSLIDKPSADSQEVTTGIVLDCDSEEHLLGINIALTQFLLILELESLCNHLSTNDSM